MLVVGGCFSGANWGVKLQEDFHVGALGRESEETKHLEICVPVDLHVRARQDWRGQEPTVHDRKNPLYKTQRLEHGPQPEPTDNDQKGLKEILLLPLQVCSLVPGVQLEHNAHVHQLQLAHIRWEILVCLPPEPLAVLKEDQRGIVTDDVQIQASPKVRQGEIGHQQKIKQQHFHDVLRFQPKPHEARGRDRILHIQQLRLLGGSLRNQPFHLQNQKPCRKVRNSYVTHRPVQ